MVNFARFKSLCESLCIEGHLFASTWGKEAHLRALQSNIKHNNNNNSNNNGMTNSLDNPKSGTVATTNNINSRDGISNGSDTRSSKCNNTTGRNDNK